MNETNKPSSFPKILVVLVVVLILCVGIFYLYNSMANKPSGPVDNGGGSALVTETPKVEPKRIEFSYKISSVDAQEIVLTALTAEGGDITVTKDFIVAIYNGPTVTSPKMQYYELKVGDTVNVEVLPKTSATLFVSQM